MKTQSLSARRAISRIRSIFLALAFANLAANLANAQQLLLDPGFDGAYVNGVATNWAKSVFGGPTATYSEDTTTYHTGPASQKVVLSGMSSTTAAMLLQQITTTGGHVYQASVWIKASVNTQIELALRQALTANTNFEAGATLMLNATTNWQQVVIRGGFQQSAGAQFVVDFLASNGTIWVDDASLTDITTSYYSGMVTNTGLIPASYFGIHINKYGTNSNQHTNWPALQQGVLRLWDSGTRWNEIQKTGSNDWSWSTMDRLVGLVTSNNPNCQILYTMGQTPTWAASRPTELADDGPGAASEPSNTVYWTNYIYQVATRYKGIIKYYELWNEVDGHKVQNGTNFHDFYSGDVPTMVNLTKLAQQTLKYVDPTIQVLSPNITRKDGLPFLEQFLQQGGGQYVDIISSHSYLTNGPENILPHLIGLTDMVSHYPDAAGKPQWNTEGAAPEGPAAYEDPGIVSRVFLFQWIFGVANFNWYGWDLWNTANGVPFVHLPVALLQPQLAPGGIGYSNTVNWLVGAQMTWRSNDTSSGTWSVELQRPNTNQPGEFVSSGHVVWNPGATATFTIPTNWNVYQFRDTTGGVFVVSGSTITVSNMPVILDGNAPAAPTGPGATPVGTTINLTWSASTGASGYNVKRSTLNGGPYITIGGSSSASYSDSGLAQGTTYYYVISATNYVGESANSAQASATTIPAPPTGLTAIGGSGQVTLNWTGSTGATSYNVKRSLTSNGTYTTVSGGNTSATHFTDTTVASGTTYYYEISALNTAGESVNSADASATTIPAPPTSLSATGGTGQISLNWTAPTGATSYNVKRSLVSGGPYTTVTNTTSAFDTDTGLASGTTYYYVVSALDASGESANSAEVNAITAPPFPTNLSASGGVNQASLTWHSSTGASSYNVKRSTTSGGPYTTVTNTTSTADTDTGLAGGTTYYYVVSALNAGGESANSAQAGATTIPAPPTGLTATSGDTEVTLNWSGSTGATSYNVKRSLASGGTYATLPGGNTSNTTFTDTSVTNGTTFYYEVSALNATGESADSAFAGATPPLIGLDIGAVGLPGNFTASIGTYTMNGAGTNIYQTNDNFFFAYRAWTGDVELVTHVLSVSNTSIYAKAGIMIRQDLTTNSPMALADVTPGYGIEFIRRYTAGGISTNTLVTNLTAPYWVKLVRTDNTISSYRSADGTNWILSGSDTVTLSPTVYVGLIVNSHNTNELCTATFDNLTIADPWLSEDIGATGALGGAMLNATNDTFTVWGAGTDIYGTNDEFQYVYQPMYTNGFVVVKVLSVQDTSGWAKGGVMIRQSLTTNSIHALVDVSATNGIEFNRRLTNGGTTTHTFTNGFFAPYWVMLTRTNGTNFTASRSPDGVTWTTVGSDIITMTNPVYVGLIVCSHTNGILCTNTFDNLSVTPGP